MRNRNSFSKFFDLFNSYGIVKKPKLRNSLEVLCITLNKFEIKYMHNENILLVYKKKYISTIDSITIKYQILIK